MAIIKCNECGKEISDSAASCPFCGAPVTKTVFCRECGTKIPEGSGFCPNCGAKTGMSPAVRKETSGKDRITAALLCLFLGSLGIHYFYLGKTTAGILSIVISLCSCGIWYMVMFIQAIVMLTMSDEAFKAKYVDTDKTFPLF